MSTEQGAYSSFELELEVEPKLEKAPCSVLMLKNGV